MTRVNNIFSNLKIPEKGEFFEELISLGNISIEKIVSSEKLEAKIYNQDHDEWILLLEGSAKLELSGKVHDLSKGDFMLIEKERPHRVVKTTKGTIWLAIHIH